ncbi:MAG: thioredoxin domain-containing protein, partial [Alphaproteobacteria bacterium]|nr:thioredoxin domain-containing protein [Alphaproteobacteria bacterium]
NKPILLSVGYAACHWCHVMAHESFENPEIAAVMNELFINIKVDREERPDIDALYQQALALLGEQGGWPLTMFLTPDGEPFWGGTYFPNTPRFGRPGFTDVLRQVAGVHQEQPDRVRENVGKLVEGLAKLATPEPGAGIDLAVTDAVAKRLVREIDPFWGGLGGAPKFPQPTLLLLLWRAGQRSGLEPYRHAVTLTLNAMAEGGIYDHLGGGFARYSVDEEWLAPHFEKMLYDNAQLIELMAIVGRDTGSPLLAQRVAETVAWLEREMLAENGAFAASYDADSEGEEGRFYVWSAAEIDSVLSEFDPDLVARFKQVYDVRPTGNWEGHTILNRRRLAGSVDAETDTALAPCRAALFEHRKDRLWPAWDDKVLADWNGLAIAGLAEAGGSFTRPDWLALARRAFDATVAALGHDDGRLHHAWRRGRAAHPATVDDYAALMRAAIRLYEATADVALLNRALSWVSTLDRHYRDAVHGGYFATADDTTDVIQRGKTAMDNAVPAGNGVLVEVFARLWLLTGDGAYRDRAETIVRAFAGEVARRLSPLASLLLGNELLIGGRQVVISGTGSEANMLHTAALAAPGPARVVQRLDDTSTLADGHPAAGKTPIDGKAAAYVCDGPVCSLPLTDPAALRDRLAA